MPLLGTFTHGLLSVLYPPVCLGCRRRTENPRYPLCDRCQDSLTAVTPARIKSVLRRLPTIDPAIDIGCSLWVFEHENALQALLHALKYGNRPHVGREMGRVLGRTYVKQISDQRVRSADFLLPVPLFRVRYLERGYNQSMQLARGMNEVLELPLRDDLLIRSRATRSQTNLSRRRRWENVSNAFTVAAGSPDISGRSILLVDDVLTTGSTLSAAAQTLKAAGAATVHVATLAVARLNEKDHSSRY